MNTARGKVFGLLELLQQAGIAAGGYGGTYPGRAANTEQYNGTAWTEVG